MDVSGKSGLASAGCNFDVGPSSDHLRPGLMASPLKRWNVVMPIPGFTRTVRSSLGRTTMVGDCGHNGPQKLHDHSNTHPATRVDLNCGFDLSTLRSPAWHPGKSVRPESYLLHRTHETN